MTEVNQWWWQEEDTQLVFFDRLEEVRLEQDLLKLLRQREELDSAIQQVKQSKYVSAISAFDANRVLPSRYILSDFIQLVTYRQKEIISEIYRYVYPIVNDQKNDYFIASIKLLPAEEKTHQASSRL